MTKKLKILVNDRMISEKDSTNLKQRQMIDSCKASIRKDVEQFIQVEGKQFCVSSSHALPVLAKQPEISSRLSVLKKNLKSH